MPGGKVVVGGISIILVVGVAIGLIAGLHGKGGGDDKKSEDDAKLLSTTTKAVAAFCSPTDFKQQCINTFKSLANNNSATPRDFVFTAINFAMMEVGNAIGKSHDIGMAGNSSGRQKMATEDCKEMLDLAIADLESSILTVDNSDSNNVHEKAVDLKNWLSAVISYQQSCIDGFDNEDVKTAIQNGLVNATQLTSNALAIVAHVAQLAAQYGIIPLNFTSSRRLFENDETKEDGNNPYPTWFSAADRKLLASGGMPAPNAVVAKDGSGQYKTIAAALAAYPKGNKGRFVIYVKAGIYNEQIIVEKDQVNIFMYGDGPRKTIVTGKKSFLDGITTYKTSTFCEFHSPYLI